MTGVISKEDLAIINGPEYDFNFLDDEGSDEDFKYENAKEEIIRQRELIREKEGE